MYSTSKVYPYCNDDVERVKEVIDLRSYQMIAIDQHPLSACGCRLGSHAFHAAMVTDSVMAMYRIAMLSGGLMSQPMFHWDRLHHLGSSLPTADEASNDARRRRNLECSTIFGPKSQHAVGKFGRRMAVMGWGTESKDSI